MPNERERQIQRPVHANAGNATAAETEAEVMMRLEDYYYKRINAPARSYTPVIRRRGGKNEIVARRILEERLGMRLPRDIHVHHVNGDETDNRIENLQIMTASAHTRYHLTGRPRPLGVRRRIGLSRARAAGSRLYTESEVDQMRRQAADGWSWRRIGREWQTNHHRARRLVEGRGGTIDR